MDGHDAGGLLSLDGYKDLCSFDQWAEALKPSETDAEAAKRIRQATQTGRPLGDASFVEELAASLDRDFGKARPGRKPKTAVKSESAAAGANQGDCPSDPSLRETPRSSTPTTSSHDIGFGSLSQEPRSPPPLMR